MNFGFVLGGEEHMMRGSGIPSPFYGYPMEMDQRGYMEHMDKRFLCSPFFSIIKLLKIYVHCLSCMRKHAFLTYCCYLGKHKANMFSICPGT